MMIITYENFQIEKTNPIQCLKFAFHGLVSLVGLKFYFEP